LPVFAFLLACLNHIPSKVAFQIIAHVNVTKVVEGQRHIFVD